MTLKEELAQIEAELKGLEERRRALYQRSTEAPTHEKLCEDRIAEALAEPPFFRDIEYPIAVTGITFTGKEVRQDGYPKRKLVRIRPCAAEFEGKTFLGLYLGDLATTVGCSFNSESGVLEVYQSHHNPAIWIPSRECIVFGFESWWGPLESEDQLKAITDESIQSLWYVQALKALMTSPGQNVEG